METIDSPKNQTAQEYMHSPFQQFSIYSSTISPRLTLCIVHIRNPVRLLRRDLVLAKPRFVSLCAFLVLCSEDN